MYPLRVDKLSIKLPDGTQLCQELSFNINPGEILVLMGPSGSGKSTILSWLTGTLDNNNLPVEKRSLGLMLQQDYLFPHMSVGENLKFGLRGGSKLERQSRVNASLKSAGLEGMGNRDPATLSGGQRARVSLLRTLLSEPCALLLDEPFSRLDVTLRSQIRDFTWHSAAKLPTLLVTHDDADVPPHASILNLSELRRE